MKLLLKIFLSLLVIIVLLLLAGFFMPGTMTVSRHVVLQASPGAVFQQVNSLKRFNDWSPWSEMDTTTQYVFSGDEGVGASYTWKSDHSSVGSGEMTITESIPCEKVAMELLFDGREETSYAAFMLAEAEEGTKLTWSFESPLGNNPINRYVGWFISKAMDEQYKKGLNMLQALMETKTSTDINIPIEEVERPPFQAIGVHSAAPNYFEMDAPMQAAFAQLGTYLGRNRLTPTTPFISVYLSGPETGSVRFFCGAGSEQALSDSAAPVQPYTVQGGRYVKATHRGSYEGLYSTHEQIGAYLEANALRVGGPVWDEYVVSGQTNPDTTQWMTHVYYPVVSACEKGE